MTPTDDVADAGVVVFNTCAIRENADNRLYGNLGHLKPLKDGDPSLRIVVAGCLAQKDRGEIQRTRAVGGRRGRHARPPAPARPAEGRRRRDGPQMDVREYTEVFPSALPAARHDRVPRVGVDRAGVRQRVHVLHRAARPRARSGRARSATSSPRCRASRGSGVVEVTLLGQNVNTYGRDVTVPGSSNRPLFAELLRAGRARSTGSGACGSRRRTRTTSRPDVIDAMAETPAVCEHIHFPLQSGSDRVLKAMRRSYRRDRYLGWLDAIRAAIPDIAVSTDVIVGFPGETEEDFADTLDVVERAAVRQRVHVPVLAAPGHAGRVVRRPGPEGGRAGALRPAGRAAAAHLARTFARAGRRHVRGAGGRGRASGVRPRRPAPGPTGSCTSPTRSSRARSSTPGSSRRSAHHLAGELVPAPEAVAV